MVAIVILNYNTYKDTINCVKSLKTTTSDVDYKIFIVDNHSNDNSYQILKNEYNKDNDVKVVQTKLNEGYSSGNNFICKNLNTDIYDKICIVNSDIIFNNNAIKYMSDVIEKDVSVAGPSVLDKNGNETQLLRKKYDFWTYMCSKKPLYYLRNLNSLFATEYDFSDDNFEFYGMVSGCCFMIDSKTFKNIGYFDDNVFLYCEEWIIAYLMEKLNKKVCYVPRASVTHYHGKSTENKGKGFISMHLYISAFYYLKYYVKINVLLQIYIYMQNIMIYAVRSIYDSSYRKNIRKLFKYSNKILFSAKRKKIKIRNQ